MIPYVSIFILTSGRGDYQYIQESKRTNTFYKGFLRRYKKKNCFSFLWKGNLNQGGYHLVKWQTLSQTMKGVGASNIFICLEML
jgi:hypothetical protein